MVEEAWAAGNFYFCSVVLAFQVCFCFYFFLYTFSLTRTTYVRSFINDNWVAHIVCYSILYDAQCSENFVSLLLLFFFFFSFRPALMCPMTAYVLSLFCRHWNNSILLLSSVAIVRHNNGFYYLYSFVDFVVAVIVYSWLYAHLHIRFFRPMFGVFKIFLLFIHTTDANGYSSICVMIAFIHFSAFSLRYESMSSWHKHSHTRHTHTNDTHTTHTHTT